MLDLTDFDWYKFKVDYGSAGCCPKYFDGTDYYKLSTFNTTSGFYGVESQTEVIVSRFCDIIGLPHIHYDGDSAKVKMKNKVYDTYVCWSKDFSNGQSKISYEYYCDLKGLDVCDIVDNFKSISAYKDYCIYCLLDFLIINRDRHSANIEFLLDNDNVSVVSPFDNGFSLLAPYTNDIEGIRKFDTMRDVKVNTCLVSDRSLYSGITQIRDTDITLNKITKRDLYSIFDSDLLRYLPGNIEYAEKIVDILWRRYEYARGKKVFNTQ